MKTILIGQAPSRTSDPLCPLSGDPLATRLASACGMTTPEYLRAFDRRNLLDRWPGRKGRGDAFPLVLARARAAAMFGAMDGRRVVLLGRNVAKAFGLSRCRFLRWQELGPFRTAVLPHPSGLCLWWNSSANQRAARRFLRREI